MLKVWGRSAYVTGVPVVAVLMASVAPVRAGLDTTIEFNMPAGDLGAMLVAISRLGGIMISFPPGIVTGRQAGPLQGSLTIRAALMRVLGGTGLHIEPSAGGVTVVANTATSAPASAGLGDIAVIDVTDESRASRFGDIGFQAGDAGDSMRLAGAAAKEIPVSIGIVTSQVIRSQGLVTATDAVRNVAGVNVGSSEPNNPTFTIRGFKSTGVSIDGQRVSGFGNGGFGQVAIDDVERVEVLKGPSSILSGTSGQGGNVNISTKQPSETVIRTATLRYGTFNYRTLAADLGGPIEGTQGLTYRFNLSGNMADQNYAGYRDEHEYLVSPVVKWDNGTTSVSAGFRYLDQSKGINQYTFFPRNESDDDPIRPIFRIPRGTAIVNPILSFSDKTTTIYSNQSHNFGDIFGFNTTISNKFKHETASNSVNSFNWDGSADPDIPNAWRLKQSFIPYNFTRLINQTDLTLTYDAGFAKQTSKFGFDYLALDMSAKTNTGPDQSANPLTGLPQFPVFRSNNSVDTILDTARGTGYGYYYIEKFDTLDDRLHILGTVRQDDNKYVATNVTGGVVTGQPATSTGLSWTAGGAFDVTPYFTVYGNRSIGMIPQYTVNIGTGQAAPPQNRDQVEVGGRFSLFDKKLNVTVARFDLQASNVGVCDPVRGCNFVSLISGQTSKGYEIEVQGEIFTGLNIIGSFAAVSSKDVSTNPPTRINGVPLLTGSVWSTYSLQDGPLNGLTVGLGARGNTDSLTSAFKNDGTRKVPGYLTADAMIGYTYDRWDLQIKFNNIFDKYYYNPSYFSNYVGIAEGRSILFQAKYDFQ